MLPKFISKYLHLRVRLMPYLMIKKSFIYLRMIFVFLLVPLLLLLALISRITRITRINRKPKILFGIDGIINDSYFANSLKENYLSNSVTRRVLNINTNNDFDIVTGKGIMKSIYYSFFFLFKYDIFHLSFNGGFISIIGLEKLEPIIYKLAGIKTVISAYGADVSLYDKMLNTAYVHSVLSHYPVSLKRKIDIENQIKKWSKFGNIISPAMFAGNGFFRWDLVMPNSLVIDTKKIYPNINKRKSKSIKIVHSPNHTIIKGTDFLIKAVSELKQEGLNVELIIIHGKQNKEVLDILINEADILVEKLIGPSYALSGIEGMACGLPVISNINTPDWSNYMKLFYRYSFLNECPILSSNPETIKDILKILCMNEELRVMLGESGRKYVEKYHSYKTSNFVFGKIYDKIWYEKDVDLMNLFNPLNPESYNNQSPVIEHPLVKNKITEELMKKLNK